MNRRRVVGKRDDTRKTVGMANIAIICTSRCAIAAHLATATSITCFPSRGLRTTSHFRERKWHWAPVNEMQALRYFDSLGKT